MKKQNFVVCVINISCLVSDPSTPRNLHGKGNQGFSRQFRDIHIIVITFFILCYTFQLLHLKCRFNAGQYAIGGLRMITRIIYICLDGTRQSLAITWIFFCKT